MSRISALEAVALAAKKWQQEQPKSSITDDFDCTEAESELADALIDLDACPQAEPVEGRPEPLKDLNNDSVCLGHWQMRDHIKALEAFCDQLQSLIPAPADEANKAYPYTRPVVRGFAQRMEAQLKANDHRGGWGNNKPGYFHERIHANLVDLGTHRANGDWEAYRRTCADIANFSMMLADNAPLPPSPHTGLEKT